MNKIKKPDRVDGKKSEIIDGFTIKYHADGKAI